MYDLYINLDLIVFSKVFFVFNIDDKNINLLQDDLVTFKVKALTFATRATLNELVFESQQLARDKIKDVMILRNKFTVKSIQVEKAKTLRISNQSSIIGSTLDYMEVQEFGSVKTKSSNKKGVAIPTAFSAGQSLKAKPRTRATTRKNRLSNIILNKRIVKRSSLKQRNLIIIKLAAQSSLKYVYLNLGRTKGIFKVTGTKKRPKINMVYNLTNLSVRIPKNPWLLPSFNEAQKLTPDIYRKALIVQLDRHKLFVQK